MMTCPSDELLRNGSGYIDPTAYAAMSKIEKEYRKMNVKRGYIYWYAVKPNDLRPALVVSADFRSGDEIINIIVLSEDRRNERDVIVGGIYYADPGAVSFAWSSRVMGSICAATEGEMDELDEEIMYNLGLNFGDDDEAEDADVNAAMPEPRNFAVELAEAKTEARIYRELYERLQSILAGCGRA